MKPHLALDPMDSANHGDIPIGGLRLDTFQSLSAKAHCKALRRRYTEVVKRSKVQKRVPSEQSRQRATAKSAASGVSRDEEEKAQQEQFVEADDPVARLEERAAEVFGAKDRAVDWCYSPIAGLGGRRPIDMVETRPGRRAVFEELGRIEHGVF